MVMAGPRPAERLNLSSVVWLRVETTHLPRWCLEKDVSATELRLGLSAQMP